MALGDLEGAARSRSSSRGAHGPGVAHDSRLPAGRRVPPVLETPAWPRSALARRCRGEAAGRPQQGASALGTPWSGRWPGGSWPLRGRRGRSSPSWPARPAAGTGRSYGLCLWKPSARVSRCSCWLWAGRGGPRARRVGPRGQHAPKEASAAPGRGLRRRRGLRPGIPAAFLNLLRSEQSPGTGRHAQGGLGRGTPEPGIWESGYPLHRLRTEVCTALQPLGSPQRAHPLLKTVRSHCPATAKPTADFLSEASHLRFSPNLLIFSFTKMTISSLFVKSTFKYVHGGALRTPMLYTM